MNDTAGHVQWHPKSTDPLKSGRYPVKGKPHQHVYSCLFNRPTRTWSRAWSTKKQIVPADFDQWLDYQRDLPLLNPRSN